MARRVNLRHVEDDTIGCTYMISTGLDPSDEHGAKGVRVALFGEKNEDVLDVYSRQRREDAWEPP